VRGYDLWGIGGGRRPPVRCLSASEFQLFFFFLTPLNFNCSMCEEGAWLLLCSCRFWASSIRLDIPGSSFGKWASRLGFLGHLWVITEAWSRGGRASSAEAKVEMAMGTRNPMGMSLLGSGTPGVGQFLNLWIC
jgi:hypothetical protein